MNVTLYQTNEILAKANVLVEDVNGKVATIDPLFVAIADLSESVSDLNFQARHFGQKQVVRQIMSQKLAKLLSLVRWHQKYLVKRGKSMSKFFKTLVVGAASGAAAAYFLSTEKGKALKNRAEKAYQSYKENPDDYHQLAKEKGSEYSHLARETFYDVKDKLATGEMTKEEILELLKDKTTAFVQKTKETLVEVEGKKIKTMLSLI